MATLRRPLRAPLVRASVVFLVGFLAVSVGVATTGRLSVDRNATRVVRRLAPESWMSLMSRVSTLGLVVVVLTTAFGMALWAIGKARSEGRFLSCAVGGAMVVKWFMKMAISRPPHRSGAVDEYPSGQAAGTMALAAAVIILLWPTRFRWLAAVPVAFAMVVGVSLVFVEQHYPSDVLGGWLLAAGWTIVACVLLGPDAEVRARPPRIAGSR